MKELMDGYVGVKFKTLLLGSEIGFNIDDIFSQFQKNCRRLKRHGMTPQNAGNISVRHNKGFIITASGSNLGGLQRDDIVYVRKCTIEDNIVAYRGPNLPSSETFMHSMILDCKPAVRAVVHVHDPETLNQATMEIEATEKEVPYGTLELARMACDSFLKADKIIVLKNHGYVAIGLDLNEAADLVISAHLNIKEKGLDSVSYR